MENKKDILKTVTRYAQAGEWDKVIKEYLKLLQLDPNDISLLNSLADAYAKIDEDRKAFEIYLKVLKDAETKGNQAKIPFLHRKIAKLNPRKFDLEGKALHEKLSKIVGAQSTFDTGNIEDALPALKEALKQDRANLDVLLKLAEGSEKKMVYGDAIEYFTLAMRLQLAQENFAAALASAKRVLALDKVNFEANAVVAEDMMKNGSKNEAEELFKDVLISMADKNMTAVGIESAKRASKLGIEYGRQFHAYFLFRENKHEEAKKILEAVSSLTPEEKLLLGKIYFKTGEFVKAKDVMLSMDPEILESSEEVLEQVGDIFLKLTEYRKASEYYMKAMRQLFASDAMDPAIGISAKVKNVDADNEEMHEMLAKIYAKKGMKTQLMEEYAKLAVIYDKHDKKAEAMKIRQTLDKLKMV